jgi:putative membrane protein
MNGVLLGFALVFVFLAAIVHLGIFLLESVLWSRPRVWRIFGVGNQQDADTLRFLAYNQGFYNVFLALGAGTGLVLIGANATLEGGIAIAAFALVSMVLAAVVLVTANSRLWRGALIQGGPALLGVLFLGLAFLAR